MYLNLIRIFAIVTFAASGLASTAQYKKLSVTFGRALASPAPKLALALETQANEVVSEMTDLAPFNENEKEVTFVVEVPSYAKSVALFVDGQKKYTFRKSCAKDDPLWGTLFPLFAQLEVELTFVAFNATTNTSHRLELQEHITGLYKKMRDFDTHCSYGRFAVSFPAPIDPNSWSAWLGYENRLQVLVGGMYAIGHSDGEEPRLEQIRL